MRDRRVALRYRLELAVDLQDTQSLGSGSDDRDRVRVERQVGLAVVPGVEEPNSGGELGRYVDDALAGLQEPLGKWSTSAVGALDRPGPLRPGLRQPSHRREAGVPDGAIVDALHVLFLFNTLNRMANAFAWDWDSEEHVEVAAKVIHRISYRLPSFTLR